MKKIHNLREQAIRMMIESMEEKYMEQFFPHSKQPLWRDVFNRKIKKEVRYPDFFWFEACAYLLWMYASMPAAAVLPAPIARITVAAPVTASPPA